MQLFFFVYDNNHWHIHVINIPTAQVEILSSLPLRRDNYISATTKRLSQAIDKAFHAHGLHKELEVSKFVHVQPQIVQQQNGYSPLFIITLLSLTLCYSCCCIFA